MPTTPHPMETNSSLHAAVGAALDRWSWATKRAYFCLLGPVYLSDAAVVHVAPAIRVPGRCCGMDPTLNGINTGSSVDAGIEAPPSDRMPSLAALQAAEAAPGQIPMVGIYLGLCEETRDACDPGQIPK